MFNNEGKIEFERQDGCFQIGFCIINSDLNHLTKKIYLLHPQELEYYNNLKFEKRRISYLLGRVSAKNAIAHIITQQLAKNTYCIDSGIFQFPIVRYVTEKNIQVSLSHCDTLGIALAYPEEHPIAIDIEKIDENKIDAIEDFISNKEYEDIDSCFLTKSEGSILIWTIKEAISKILKTGLMADFKIFEITQLQKEGETYTSQFKYFFQYKAISRCIKNHMVTIILPMNSTCNLDHFWNNLILTLN